jgi:acyl-CoA thioesterase-1
MLDELKKRDIDVVLTGMLAAPNLGPDYAAAFNPIFPKLAKQYDAPLYPFLLDGVVADPKLMLPDNIHPNAQGVAKVVDGLAPLVAGVLKP